jgi:hypothetical protein
MEQNKVKLLNKELTERVDKLGQFEMRNDRIMAKSVNTSKIVDEAGL